MKFDLCFVLIDLDEPRYKAAACEMIRSARRAYKDHDMRIVQLTDNRSAHCPDADGVFGLDTDVKGNQFCQAKGHLMAEYALKADRPVVFCDVDLLWNNDSLLGMVERHSINLMHRDDVPCMPYNTGIVVAPDPFPAFWEEYRAICGSLPSEITGWYGDQIAMAIVPTGFDHSAIHRLAMDEIAPAIDEIPAAPLTTPAVHFKGDRTKLMPAYARLLDEGKVFDFVRPGKEREMEIIPTQAELMKAEALELARPNVTVEIDLADPREEERLRDEAFAKESQWPREGFTF
jgi:hypothetical protein